MGIGEDQAIGLEDHAAAQSPFLALAWDLALGSPEELTEEGVSQQPGGESRAS